MIKILEILIGYILPCTVSIGGLLIIIIGIRIMLKEIRQDIEDRTRRRKLLDESKM